MDVIEEIDKRIQERSILKHPFYQSWKMGKLTREMLQEYARQYYKHVAAFPQYLSAVHTQMDNATDRRLVLQNLMDEENGENNHPELWLRFAEATGVIRNDIGTVPTAETEDFIKNFLKHCKNSIVEGIAALYAYESQIPKVSEEKINGLVAHYGVTSDSGLEYFKVHMTADVEHSAAERELIRKYVTDEETKKKVLEAVSNTLDAYWNMLSGIEKICKMECS